MTNIRTSYRIAVALVGGLLGCEIVNAGAKLDFDGDGKTDLALYYPANGTWLIRQSRDGKMLGGQPQKMGWASAQAVPGDYDGDGKTDLAVFDPPSGNWSIRQSSTGQLMGGGPINWGWSESIAVPEDYDGDGKTDLAVFDKPSTTWYVRRSSDGQAIIVPTPPFPPYEAASRLAYPAPGDYNGDGMAEFSVVEDLEFCGGSIYLCGRPGHHWNAIESNGISIVTMMTLTGIKWVPTPMKLDGIADAPIGFEYQSSTVTPRDYHYPDVPFVGGTWHLPTGDTVWKNPGQSPCVPVPGDYDGDQIADLAVYVPATSLWFLKYSGGSKRQTIIKFGNRGGLPADNQYRINRSYGLIP